MLKVLRAVLLGPLNERWKALPDISLREVCTLVPLVGLVLALGVYPLLLISLQDGALQQLLLHIAGQ